MKNEDKEYYILIKTQLITNILIDLIKKNNKENVDVELIKKEIINNVYFDNFVNDISKEHILKNNIEKSREVSERRPADINTFLNNANVIKSKQLKRIKTKKSIYFSTASAILAISCMLYNYNISDQSSKNQFAYNEFLMEDYHSMITTPTVLKKCGDKIDLVTQNKEFKREKQFDNITVNIEDYNQNELDNIDYNTLIVPYLYSCELLLPDSSIVYLSSNSSLKYPSKFNDSIRNVELTGEAYFDIKKSNIPFTVTCLNSEIRVYGTQFNVNCYDENLLKTTLISGIVGVSCKNKKEVILKKSQQYVAYMKNKTYRIDSVDTRQYEAWIKGFFRTDNAPLSELLERVSNWYNVKFICENHNIPKLNISASLDRRKPIEAILEIIEVLADVKFIKDKERKVYVIR